MGNGNGAKITISMNFKRRRIVRENTKQHIISIAAA
jgi:hypothetical protein